MAGLSEALLVARPVELGPAELSAVLEAAGLSAEWPVAATDNR